MKTLFRLTLVSLFIWVHHHSFSQDQPIPKKVTELSFMVGEWQGTSTHFSPQGSEQSDVSESVRYALDSTVMVIRGTGIDQDGTKQHDALGVLYFENGSYYMHAFTMQGMNVIAGVKIIGEKSIEWGFDLPNGAKIKYTASFNDDIWQESGTYTTPDGSQSFPTVNMNLSRK